MINYKLLKLNSNTRQEKKIKLYFVTRCHQAWSSWDSSAVNLFPTFHLYQFHTFSRPSVLRSGVFERAGLIGVVAEGVVYARTFLVTLSGLHSFSFGGAAPNVVPDSRHQWKVWSVNERRRQHVYLWIPLSRYHRVGPEGLEPQRIYLWKMLSRFSVQEQKEDWFNLEW